MDAQIQNAILDIVYDAFERWARPAQFCCAEGCGTCCTRNVAITAQEGRRIIDYCRRNNRLQWLWVKLAALAPAAAPAQTTNEYVDDLFRGMTTPAEPQPSTEHCPFLEKNRCTIYPVRPFACRCFFSSAPCPDGDAATVPDRHLYGATAVMQLIEHLGQFDHWGHMIDVLTVLQIADREEHPRSSGNPALLSHARQHVRRARPLPGFILPEGEKDHVEPLLQSILHSRLEGITVEEILNGR